MLTDVLKYAQHYRTQSKPLLICLRLRLCHRTQSIDILRMNATREQKREQKFLSHVFDHSLFEGNGHSLFPKNTKEMLKLNGVS